MLHAGFPSCSGMVVCYPVAVCGLLNVVTSLVAEPGSRCAGLVVVEHRLNCSAAHGIWDQDQTHVPCIGRDMDHQGSPSSCLLNLTHSTIKCFIVFSSFNYIFKLEFPTPKNLKVLVKPRDKIIVTKIWSRNYFK